MTDKCRVDGCERQIVVKSKKLCLLHNQRLNRTGHFGLNPIKAHNKGKSTFEKRIFERFDKSSGDECWIWKGYVNPKGYGSLRKNLGPGVNTTTLAHRAVYEMMVGKIPETLQLDHLCRNRSCVNPSHLEPVTAKENVLRGIGISAKNKRKTHCKRNHEFTPENSVPTFNGKTWGKQCRICVNYRARSSARKRNGYKARVIIVEEEQHYPKSTRLKASPISQLQDD